MEGVTYQSWTECISEQKKGISGSTLKLIALVVMLIDHIGAVIVERMILWNRSTNSSEFFLDTNGLIMLDKVLRYTGRLAFPIFCFLLVEGFLHTRKKAVYAIRLFCFALISEIPFNLALTGKVMHTQYQNVFFTLLFGLFVMTGLLEVEKRAGRHKLVAVLLAFVILAAGMAVAELFNTDYGAKGVLSIAVLYIFRKRKEMQLVAGAISFLWESTAFLAFVPIAFYNGKRGLKLKYIFYVFYPLHLLVLFAIVRGMGIG